MSALQEAQRSAHILESLENYAIADELLVDQERDDGSNRPSDAQHLFVYDDEGFWQKIFASRERQWNTPVQFDCCYVSEWVPRVPGLYWKPESKGLRQVSEDLVESRSQTWVTYEPPGKSQKILGGVGTLRFPPDNTGHRLITLSCRLNASSGIPALVTPDVWEQLNHGSRADGRRLGGLMARWSQMTTEWAIRFPTIRGIPKGYIVLDQQAQLAISDDHGPIRFDPFTIMEYRKGAAVVHDFVYASTDLGADDWRGDIESFFSDYKTRDGRVGRYLLAGDIADPLWDAEFSGPAELRQSLDIISARVRKRLEGSDVIDAVLAALGSAVVSVSELGRFSDEIGIPRAIWITDGPLSRQIESFVNAVVKETGKIEVLLQQLILENPGLRRV